MDDQIQDPEDQSQAPLDTERAYAASSGGREFAGKTLEAWSGRRRAAAFEIGFTGGGSVVDPIRLVYTCWIEPNEVSMVFRSPSMATEKFLQWAEKMECLDPSQDNWDEAFAIAQGVLEEVERSQFKSGEKNTPVGDSLMGN